MRRTYEQVVAGRINAATGQLIVDVGGGKSCPYVRFIQNASVQTIVGVDISVTELALNRDVGHRVVADVAHWMPFRDGSVDLVSSRSVVEHLSDVTKFFENCRCALKDGGYVIHLFPCKFAPFSIINQILPNKIARIILFYFHPDYKDDCGFKAYYDRCYPAAIGKILHQNDFEIAHQEFGYYQAHYFDFFLPLYIVMTLYDLVISAMGLQNLSCQMLIVARRRNGKVSRELEHSDPRLEAEY